MGILDSLKAWFRTETAEAKDLLGETKGRLESDLDRREAAAAASPAERIEQLQDEIASGDDGFDALRDKIEGRGLRAEAVEELATTDAAADDGIVDAELVDAETVEPDVERPESPTGDAPTGDASTSKTPASEAPTDGDEPA